MNLNALIDYFKDVFSQSENPACYFAPGRVNIIGEHTDYNGGHVLPCAINLGTYIMAKKTVGKSIRLFSINFKETDIIETEISHISNKYENGWANYPLGIIKTLIVKGYQIDSGIDILVAGDIPNGAGLSSSASIELATIFAINDIYHLHLNRLEMVKLSQTSENEFNGVMCGIMDQFACGMGKKNHAILLHAHKLDFSYVPLSLQNNCLIIINSNQRRGLIDSGYNQRRLECIEALQAFKEILKINSLCDMTPEVFENHQQLIHNETLLKRTRHVVHENHRTLIAFEALRDGRLKLLGRLMNESHTSLRDDFEVSTSELDLLTDLALNNGAIGSRMMGAGFGGCTINLVAQQIIVDFMDNVGKHYHDQTGYTADFYIVNSDDGARKLEFTME